MIDRSPTRRRIRIHDLELNLRTEEVRRGGEPVTMSPQAFQVLACLAQRPGTLVTRDELREAVWGEDVHVDFDRSLNFTVHRLRKALGDNADEPEYIETLPRRGYRLLAPSAPSAGKVVVIVLPFENLTGDESQRHLVDGLTDEITTALGRLNPDRLAIIGRITAVVYGKHPRDLHGLADELGVTHAVEGSVRQTGDRVRVTARLLESNTQTQVWIGTFDENLEGVLGLQRDIARTIAARIGVEVGAAPAGSRDPGKMDPAAHKAYLRGRHLYFQFTPQSLEEGIGHLHRAIELEPEFVAPQLTLVDCLLTLSIRGHREMRVVRPTIRQMAARAAELEPELADARALHAVMQGYVDWRWDTAREELERALALVPSSDTRRWCAWLQVFLGETDAAIEGFDEAQRYDPESYFLTMMSGWIRLRARRPAAAVPILRNSIELQPDNPMGHVFLAESLFELGEDGARRACETAIQRHGDDPVVLAYCSRLMAGLGRPERARALLERLEGVARTDYVDPYHLGVAHGGLGAIDEAFEFLERAVEERSGAVPILAVDQFLDPLRPDPRFAQLADQVSVAPFDPRGGERRR